MTMNAFTLRNFTRGTICVFRQYNGEATPLMLIEQTRYAEYLGCFSVL